MSLYLGKKADGKGIMVATTAQKTIAQLKAIAPIDCEFHSDLPFLTYKRFEATVTDYGHKTHTTGYLLSSNGGPTYSIAIAEFPEVFYSNYLDRQLIIIIDNEMSLAYFGTHWSLRNKLASPDKCGQKWVSFLPTGSIGNYPVYTPVYTPSQSNRYLLVPKRAVNQSYRDSTDPYTLPRVSVLVTNFKLDGTYVNPAVNDYSQGIKVKNNSFFINGYDLFSLNYLSNVSLSGADVRIKTDQADFYLVGEDDSVQGIQLQSAPGRTRLFKGNHVLFDTLYGRRGHIFAGAISYSVANDTILYGQKFDWSTMLIRSPAIAATKSTAVNVIINLKITCNNPKYNNASISSNFNNLPCYQYSPKSYGAMSFCLNTSDYVLVGIDEYYIRVGSFDVYTMQFYKVYIRRVINSGKVELELHIKQNDDYTNTSGNVALECKAIMFV